MASTEFSHHWVIMMEVKMEIGGVALKDLFPLSEAASKIPGRRPGKAIGRSTLERWRTKGVRGIILRAVRVGTTLCTCDAWLNDFFQKLNAVPPVEKASELRTPTQRER